MELLLFCLGIVVGLISSLAVVSVLQLPMQTYLAEVCCGKDRGLFWWRIVAVVLLLSGTASSIMAPAIPGWIFTGSERDAWRVFVVQLRVCWLALCWIMIATACVTEYFERKQRKRIARPSLTTNQRDNVGEDR